LRVRVEEGLHLGGSLVREAVREVVQEVVQEVVREVVNEAEVAKDETCIPV